MKNNTYIGLRTLLSLMLVAATCGFCLRYSKAQAADLSKNKSTPTSDYLWTLPKIRRSVLSDPERTSMRLYDFHQLYIDNLEKIITNLNKKFYPKESYS